MYVLPLLPLYKSKTSIIFPTAGSGLSLQSVSYSFFFKRIFSAYLILLSSLLTVFLFTGLRCSPHQWSGVISSCHIGYLAQYLPSL
uniref:Uncharacterized protein n=1 Tax=uncultured marine virus TaxID=186617 RepID=A0A0F7L6Z4_9VIRU|nr:hypothetical protein [uncultured marine virus]